jgi:copper(I)-binding protein
MSMVKKIIIALSLAFVSPAFAATTAVTVTDLHCLPASKGATIPIYFTSNSTDASDTLLSAFSPIATSAVLMTGETNMKLMGVAGATPMMMTMMNTMQTKAELPATISTNAKDHWSHIMLQNIKTDLVKGQIFNIVLTFKNVGPIAEEVKVQ